MVRRLLGLTADGDGIGMRHGGGSGALIEQGADVILRGFEAYHGAFLEITRRAKARFERRDWRGVLADGRERLELYDRVLQTVVADVRNLLGPRAREESLWTLIRGVHSQAILGHPAAELGETFFNSVTRRVFRTVGINPAIEYLDFQFDRVPPALAVRPYRAYVTQGGLERAVRAALEDPGFAAPFADLEGDALGVARRLERAWAAGGAPLPLEDLEVLKAVFYRRKGAYLVGRARGGTRVMPLALALTHGAGGIAVDAVLLTEADISIVFSFTRSYFHADAARPAEVIEFLRGLMPVKPVSELYNALGHNKHGKTELYRELRRHLARTDEKFTWAPGARGLVMAVFTLPSFDVVFKVIRDSFPPPKETTPDEVKRRYELVFAHDRAGRLVDAHAFEELSFPTGRFSEALLTELLQTAGRSVRLAGDEVVVRHVYAERRVRPLDLYLRDADADQARRAALDYGHAIRELAATGVFPGDLLLKNFGVTRHGRVVFYDYDELRLLTECTFRDVPEPSHPEDELAGEPWFYVGPNDVFPEELARFIPFNGAARQAFLGTHGELYGTAFWRSLQARHAAGDIVDIFPYAEVHRLREEPGTAVRPP